MGLEAKDYLSSLVKMSPNLQRFSIGKMGMFGAQMMTLIRGGDGLKAKVNPCKARELKKWEEKAAGRKLPFEGSRDSGET